MEEKKRVLIIDDDSECLEFAKTVLVDEGYEVIIAVDGQEGLKKAVSEHPDLIVLDVMMPEKTGWETCDELRSTKEGIDVPIVYLTCIDPPRSLYEPHGAFGTDWDEYLTKPVTPKKLADTVKKLLNKSAPTH